MWCSSFHFFVTYCNLNNCHFVHLFSLISLAITNALNYSSGIICIIIFFQLFFILFQLKAVPLYSFDKFSLFEFSLFELSEPVPYCGFKVVSLKSCVKSVCAQCLCWKSWVWYNYKSHLSSGCSDSSHLYSRLKYTCWGQAWTRTFPLLTGHHYPGVGLDPKFLEQNPWGVGCNFPLSILSVCSPICQHWYLWLREE